nr:hypothetical protein [Mycobacterium sp. 3519A]
MALGACGDNRTPPSAPSTSPTTTTTPTTAAPALPTEKSLDPHGGNRFTPPVLATPAPNVPPGQHPGINGVP